MFQDKLEYNGKNKVLIYFQNKFIESIKLYLSDI